ncbi:hypothetical protein QZH41_020529 [Actinostola sp. cb2023]|nr:hypothetical protein QZH41_020529 [Actinostola sp. cb2023]
MFWKFELHPSTAIDSILSKEDCTLTEILDEDDVLQETKSQNRKLINFFVRPEILEELVNLIITEPDEDFDEKLRYKHPNTACEVLTSDVYTIIDKLASSEDLLNKLWSFLESDPPLNPLLASFFSKVIGVLISRKTSLMLDYLKTKEDFVSLLSKHLSTSAIMDLLLRLVTSVESPQLRADLLEWLNEQKLIEALVSLIDPEIDEDKNSNAAQTLSDVIRLSRDHQSQMQESATPDLLLDTIQKRETIGSLLDHMFHGIHSHNDSALVNGIFVLLTLLEVKKGTGEGEEPMTALDAERLAQGVSATLAALTPRLQDFHDLLTDPPLMKPMYTTIGTLDPPLGNARLQIAKLVSSILSTNGDTINKELANIGTIKVLWELFFKYPWNNFLHTQVERCISTILNNPPTEEDGELHTPLVDTLFKDCKCIQKIIDTWEDPDPEITQSQARHKGYMGHLTNIANYIVYYREKGRNKDIIESIFNEIPEKDREKWNSFVSGTLAEINKTNTTELVGHHPLQSSSDDDEDSYKPVPFLPSETSLQHVFSNYQMQQMTADFMDTFGLDEDEFQEPNDAITSPFDRIGDISFNINANEDNPNSALFEACCNERIQQFDDSGSDEEDVWEEKELTFSSVIENRKSTLSDSDSDSTGSEEEDQESPRIQSTESSGSDDDRIVFTDDSGSPTGSPAKKILTIENKMDIDTGNTWNEFDSSEVAMDEAVAMDASDVGWDKTPDTNTTDTGWANFDNFTDIGMAAATTEQTSKRPDSPVAMETETSPTPPEDAATSPSPASAYSKSVWVVEEDKQVPESKPCDDPSKGLVLDTSSLFVNQPSDSISNENNANSSPVETAPLPPRAANYSCEKDDGVPLASNDSDDDISDEDDSVLAQDAQSSISPENLQLKVEPFSNMVMETPKATSADPDTTVCQNSREEPVADHPSPLNTINQSETPKDNGPVDVVNNPDNQSECSSISKTSKLEEMK